MVSGHGARNRRVGCGSHHAFNLGFAFIFAASTVALHHSSIRLILIGYEVVAVPHFIFHAYHLHGFPMAEAIFQTVGLAVVVALPLALIGLTFGRNPFEKAGKGSAKSESP